MRFVHTLVAFAVVSLSAFSAQSAFAQAKTFKIDDSGNKIQFVSDAKLEKITGQSTQASGEIIVDPAKPAQSKADAATPVEKKIIANWEQVKDLYMRDQIIDLMVTGHNRGGLLVEGDDIFGFVPFSHLIDLMGKLEWESSFDYKVERSRK